MLKNKLYILFIICSFSFPQINVEELIDLSITSDKEEYELGSEIVLNFNFIIKDDFRIYSVDTSLAPPFGNTEIIYSSRSTSLFSNSSSLLEPIPIRKYDKNFEMYTSYHEGCFRFDQNLKLADEIRGINQTVVGTLYAIACDPKMCVPIDKHFEFNLKIINANPDSEIIIDESNDFQDNSSKTENNDSDNEEYNSIWELIIAAILGGLAALATPCVFPMIPITVSYFTKLGENKKDINPLKTSSFYALSIVGIFTVLGLVVTILLKTSYGIGIEDISAHGITNIFIALLFIIFAFSLLGFFEIQIPSFITQLSLKQESRGGYVGIFFMALTFTLTAFTCTGAFIAAILGAAITGSYFYPIVGMIVFSSVLAVPFFLLALFPQSLAKLPKSGGWLNSVKVVMGFIELAAALKFLSVADTWYKWGIFTREALLVLWIFIFLLIIIYILGFIQFKHDSKVEKLSMRRILISIFILLFCLYLSTGLYNPLIYESNSTVTKKISSFIESYLPPKIQEDTAYLDFLKKYRDEKSSKNLFWIENLSHAMKIAREEEKGKKLIFLDFTGYACTNCRQMEKYVFVDDRVKNLFKEMILTKLYVDGSEKKNKEYKKLKENTYGSMALPFYVIVDANKNVISTYHGFDLDIDKFINFLEDALNK